MACRCSERRAAILGAVKNPSTVLTAARFVVKTSVEDISRGAKTAALKTRNLQRRGLKS